MSTELVVALLALVTSVVSAFASIWLYNRELRFNNENHLTDLWHNILDISRDNPRYLDVNITEGYKRHMTHDERVRYDIYCQKAWGHVHEIVDRGLHTQPRFRAAIQWLVTFHLEWLKDNPAFFQNEEFWKAVDLGKNEPAVILRHRPMPTTDDDRIDWDTVAEDYHSYVLSPYNPAMLSSTTTTPARNQMVNDLRGLIEDAQGEVVEIADFGCGTGNLVSALAGLPVRVVGVDISEESLAVAATAAAKAGVAFEPIRADMSDPDFTLNRKFDVIVSSNSVLPEKRSEVLSILGSISRHLTEHDGTLYAIFPSYDTTEYLNDLWRAQFLSATGSQLHADRVADALRRSKLSDADQLMYADDGHTQQCYHSPDSLARELPAAGLQILGEPTKVYYPWELTRRFDYGWFPEADEEIWDWYVKARTKAPAADSTPAPQ